VLPTTSQSYGAAGVTVNGDHHRWWLCIPHEFPATLPSVPVQVRQQVPGCSTLAKPVPEVLRELGRPDSNRVFRTDSDRHEHATATNAQTDRPISDPAAPPACGWRLPVARSARSWSLGDSGQLTGRGIGRLRSANLNSAVTSVACLLSSEYFQRGQARGGRMRGQWVDGARRLIDGTTLDSRGPTRR
jgi:hypothetical protein